MLVHWIWLAESKLSARQKYELLKHYGNAEAIYHEDPAQIRVQGIDAAAIKILEDKSLEDANRVLDLCDSKRIAVLKLDDPEYPERLKNIYDPPIVLYCRGKLPNVDEEVAIAMVGTRNASVYGLTAARKLGYQTASGGAVVVSGMARGIDSAALDGALLAGKSVIAVLGTGADVIYPKSSTKIYEQILHQGCIVSEYPPKTGAEPWHFPRRNRIISGLSCGTVVIESPESSGALITAGFARDQGRDVFVVPGNIDMDGFVGSNRLLRDGAIPVGCGWDILCEYAAVYPDKISQPDAKLQPEPKVPEPEAKMTTAKEPEKKAGEAGDGKKIIDKQAPTPYIDPASLLDRLSASEKLIAQELLEGPVLVDDVIAKTGLPAGKTMAILTMLEIRGIVSRLPGKRICLKSK